MKVGTAEEADKFAALQALVSAEMRRIHRLYYCIRLRCMVMRYDADEWRITIV